MQHIFTIFSSYMLRMFMVFAVPLALAACGFSFDPAGAPDAYTFQAIQDDAKLPQNISGIDMGDRLDRMQSLGADFGTYLAAMRGKMMTLFGAPFQEAAEAESVYEYLIEARDQHGKSWVFLVHQGAFGFSILGNPDDASNRPVIAALLARVEQATPADFEAQFYDNDTDNTIWYECKQGTCSWREQAGDQRKP